MSSMSQREVEQITKQEYKFGFVTDTKLRSLLERDYRELQRAFVSQCWKSVIILAGSVLEAVLLDLILSHTDAARSSGSAPSETDLSRWSLASLIDVAVDLGLASTGMQKLSHPVREYRNLVHPGNEIRNDLAFGAEEARIAIEVLHIAYRDLS